MNNPFKYGKIVTDEDFAGREEELTELAQTIKLGSSAAICAPFGMGKSSLLAELAGRHSKDYLFVHISLHAVANETAFLNAFVRRVATQAFGRVETFGPAAWKLLENTKHRRAVLDGDGQDEGKIGRASFPSIMDTEEEDADVSKRNSGFPGLRMCAKCGRPLKWVEKYGRFYCYSCKKYTPIKRKVRLLDMDSLLQDHIRCPRCTRGLRYVHWYSELYCDRCQRFPFVEIGARRTVKPTVPDLEEAFELPERVADQVGKNVVIMLDEFQEVNTLDNAQLLKTMGTSFDAKGNVCYLFSGSDRACFRQLFEEKDGPLHNLAGVIQLSPIPRETVEEFLVRKFRDARGRLAMESAALIAEISGGHPYYFQEIAHECYHISSSPTMKDVATAVRTVVRHRSPAYSVLWNSIRSPLHRRYLLAMASEPRIRRGEDFVRRHNLKSRSHVQRIEKQLEARGLIENGEINDPMLILWLRSSGAR